MAKKGSDELQMIYLDKNYPPAEIKLTLDLIKEQTENLNVHIRRVALVPHIA